MLALAGCRASTRESPANYAAPERTQTDTQASPPAHAKLPKVAFLGDSIAAGLHLAADQAFPAVLHTQLAASGNAFELMNGGVSGDTTAGGLRRVDWLLKQAPKVVVIELGANDGMRGVPVAEVEKNLRAIIVKVQAAGATPLLLGMLIPPNYGPEYVNAFEAMYPRLAQELHVAFVPSFMEGVAGVAALNLEDGIHPTPEGHVQLATKVAEPLRKLLTQ